MNFLTIFVASSVLDTSVEKRCTKFFSIISKGKSHICNTSSCVQNLTSCLSEIPEKIKNQVIASVIKKKVCEQKDAQDLSFTQLRGRPLHVSVGMENEKKIPKAIIYICRGFLKSQNKL